MRARIESKGADVFRGDELAGRLERTVDGATFRYADSYLRDHTHPRDGVAYALPPTSDVAITRGATVHPFFAGLLPEGARLDALLARTKASPDDLLALLLASGGDCVGDVSVVPVDARPVEFAHEIDVGALETESFDRVLEASLERTGTRDPTATFAGVQPKLSAAMISLPIRTRKGRVSYLLKLAPKAYPRLVENEAWVMALAGEAGLEVAATKLVKDRTGTAGLLVERFDRIPRGAREAPLRVHQEDGCQLLSVYPADKYNVSVGDLARALAVTSAPIVSIARLIELVAFSFAVANGDLHARNVSVRTAPATATVVLAPAYDLVSTLPYGDSRMALALDGRDAKLRRKHFVAFGERFGVPARAVETRLDRIVGKIAARVDRIGEIGFDERITKHLERTIRARLAALGE